MTTEQITDSAELQGGVTELATAADVLASAVADTNGTAVAPPDLSTPEGVRKAAEQYPALKNYREDGYGSGLEAGKQRALRELQSERGTLESVQQYHQRLTDDLIRRLNAGEDPAEAGKETPQFYTAAQERARVETWQTLYEQAKVMDPDSVSALEPLWETATTLGEYAGIAQAAMNAAANKSKALGREELLALESLDDIPAEAPLRKAMQAWHEQQLETEQMAQNIEANRREVAPSTTAGTVADGIDLSRFEGMSDAQAQTYMMNLATTNPVEYEKVKDALLTAAFGQ